MFTNTQNESLHMKHAKWNKINAAYLVWPCVKQVNFDETDSYDSFQLWENNVAVFLNMKAP